MPDRLSVIREEPESPVPVFNAEQWARDHDRRDEDRFEVVTKGITNIWQVLAFVGVTFVALTGWSLKNQYDALANQDRVLRAVYGVSNQVQQVQVTAVPKPPQ